MGNVHLEFCPQETEMGWSFCQSVLLTEILYHNQSINQPANQICLEFHPQFHNLTLRVRSFCPALPYLQVTMHVHAVC